MAATPEEASHDDCSHGAAVAGFTTFPQVLISSGFGYESLISSEFTAIHQIPARYRLFPSRPAITFCGGYFVGI
jgi:hypothetical protein